MMVAGYNEADDEVPPELEEGSDDEDDCDSRMTRIPMMRTTSLKIGMMVFSLSSGGCVNNTSQIMTIIPRLMMQMMRVSIFIFI